MRTITLKLHDPGKQKRKIIDEAMVNYSRAFQYLLDRFRGELDQVRTKYRGDMGRYSAHMLTKWIGKDINKELNKFGIQPFKDSLKIDFAMAMAGFMSLYEKNKDACYTAAYIDDDDWDRKWAFIVESIENDKMKVSDAISMAAKLAEKLNEPRPLFFCRCDKVRDYCLLYDRKNDRYYAKLYLMNLKNENRAVLHLNQDRKLEYIHKNGGFLQWTGRPERYIIMPLSFGRYQEQYLKAALKNPDILKTARLIKRNNDYYLSISIKVEVPDKIKTKTYLGCVRGIENSIYCTVVDKSENVVERFPLYDKKLSRDSLYGMANRIVKEAIKYRSQVIVESFSDRGDRLIWHGEDEQEYRPMLDYGNYNSIVEILKYKLADSGLPPPVEVSPYRIFYTCPKCGAGTVKNRFSKDIFICVSCGTAGRIEEIGSLNLSRRLIQYSRMPLKIKAEKSEDGIRFMNNDIGLDYRTSNLKGCMMELEDELKIRINSVKEELVSQKGHMDKDCRKKWSLVKKLDGQVDLLKFIKITE